MIEEVPVIEAAMDGLLKHYKDGTLRFAITIDPQHAQLFLKNFLEIGTRIGIAKLGNPATAPQPAERFTEDELKRIACSGIPKAVINKIRGPYGLQAKALRLHIDWMGNPKVWDAFGGDKEFLEWCKRQECCAAGMGINQCEGDIVAAHVRRVANGAGTGIKPAFSAVPLCNGHHQLQHANGESRFGGKEWFDKQRIDYLHDWLWHAMREQFGVSSMSEADPFQVRGYAEVHDIAQYLPKEYP